MAEITEITEIRRNSRKFPEIPESAHFRVFAEGKFGCRNT